MFLATNCEQYSYTKVSVPIKLLKSPSDYDDNVYYLDIIGENLCQEQCYIGTQRIEDLKIIRLKEADCETDQIAEWKLEMIISGGKTEEEAIAILNELCAAFSLKYVRYYKHFQHSGLEGFSYDRLHLEIRYAYEDKAFTDEALNMYCGVFQVKTISKIENKVFKLPKRPKKRDERSERLTTAFLEALKCKDKISRYILLYYLFEIMYGTDEYKALKKQYEETNPSSGGTKNNCNKNTGDKKRSVILFQYLQQEYGLKKYLSLGKSVVLDADTLEKIIKARNDLTHRGDQSKVTLLMYHHLIPILQEVINSL